MDYKELYELWLTNPYFDETQEKNLKPLKMITKRLKTDFIKI